MADELNITESYYRNEIQLARRVARIVGAQSAAAAAVRRYDELIAAGYQTRITLSNGYWLVREPWLLGAKYD